MNSSVLLTLGSQRATTMHRATVMNTSMNTWMKTWMKTWMNTWILTSVLLSATASASAHQDGCTEGGAAGTYLFRIDTGSMPLPAGGQMTSTTLSGLPEPRTLTWPNLRIRASADLGLASERLFMRIHVPGLESDWQEIAFDSETDCASPPHCTNLGPAWDAWYGQIWTGELDIEVYATPTVNEKTCPNGFIRVEIQYLSAMDDDCDGNRRNDACDIADGLLADCDDNGWADTCQLARFPELDCNGNGILDCCDAAAGARDCNQNGILDMCEITQDPALDCDQSGFLDACEVAYRVASDINLNGIPDSCDIAAGRLADCNRNGIADVAELTDPRNDIDGDLLLDACDPRSADINNDGNVGAPDLATLLDRWATANQACDLDLSGDVGAADLSLLLTAWGPAFLCGNGVLNPGENCCNCPTDAGCGDGYDCFYGACLPCIDRSCPPKSDECFAFYGVAPVICYGCTNPTYGVDIVPCYNLQVDDLICAMPLTSRSRTPGFAMHLIDAREPTLALASLGLLRVLAVPSVAFRRIRSVFRRTK